MTTRRFLRPRRLSCLFLTTCAGAFGADENAYVGEARDKRGALVYAEKHVVSSEAGRTIGSVTEYRAPDGELIATMRSDYSRSVAVPPHRHGDFAIHS